MRLPRWFVPMTKAQKRARVMELLERVETWEEEGRDMFAQLSELTDPDEPLGVECRRVLELLAG